MTTLAPSSRPVKKKPVSWQNLAIGGIIQTFEVSTLGQPFEVVKTHMAANRGDSLKTAIAKTYQRGGLSGFWQGLIPWAWIEASTKGAVLMFASSEIEHYATSKLNMSTGTAGLLGGVGGGLAQAYSTMGVCTFMKTVEVTRHKDPTSKKSTWSVAADVFRKEGIRGLNKGVTAVAVRQMTNWGSRLGISRFTEKCFKGSDSNRQLSVSERILSSVIGGALACWNQPIEVIRVEMQSALKSTNRPDRLNIWSTAKYIHQQNGVLGFYRGVTPRVGLSVYLTVCMVFGGDQVKAYFANKNRTA